MPDAEIIRAAITATSSSARGFARVIGVDERSMRRWLAGDPVPGPVIALCRILAARPALVRLIDA
jgi:DNA-binding transcriptional regulator YiaG